MKIINPVMYTGLRPIISASLGKINEPIKHPDIKELPNEPI